MCGAIWIEFLCSWKVWMYIGVYVAHTCANVHMCLNVCVCVGVASVCMCECSSVYMLVRVCSPGMYNQDESWKLGLQKENSPDVITLPGLSLFSNTVTIFSQAKIKGTYGLTHGLTKGKVFEIGSIWDMLRCVATVALRAPGNHGGFGKRHEILTLSSILFTSFLYKSVVGGHVPCKEHRYQTLFSLLVKSLEIVREFFLCKRTSYSYNRKKTQRRALLMKGSKV